MDHNHRDSDFSKELHNVLYEQFNPDRPNVVWCTDITYIWTQNVFVYLNCVMDLYAERSSHGHLRKPRKYQLLLLPLIKLLVVQLCPGLFTPTEEVSMFQKSCEKLLRRHREATLIATILTTAKQTVIFIRQRLHQVFPHPT